MGLTQNKMHAKTAGPKELISTHYVDNTFVEYATGRTYSTACFYLIDNLMHDMLASIYLIRDCCWTFVKSKLTHTFHHTSEPDENFGSCNN